MKKYGNADLAENSIYSLISLTKLKENQNFSNLIDFKNFIQWKIMELLILHKTINSMILVTKLKGNQKFSILKI